MREEQVRLGLSLGCGYVGLRLNGAQMLRALLVGGEGIAAGWGEGFAAWRHHFICCVGFGACVGLDMRRSLDAMRPGRRTIHDIRFGSTYGEL